MADQGRGGWVRTGAPQLAAAWRRRSPFWSDELARLAERLADRVRHWLEAERGAGRLVHWMAPAFGGGIALYFAAEREPALWAGPAVMLGAAVLAVAVRARGPAFAAAVLVASAAAGFSIPTWRSHLIAHPVLERPLASAELTGFVEKREQRERSDRIVLRVDRVSAAEPSEQVDRVRLSMRKGTAPAVGTYIALKARLSPPLQPLRPGSYDFARDLYFQGIGASGFVLGRISTAPPPATSDWRLRLASVIAAVREAIDARIRSVIDGDRGAIASALITGKRDAISSGVSEAMYVSSLAHVLAISGYHMALVAGVVFFAVRAGLALISPLAARYPIKKWAAMVAFVAAAFYLVLSGAEVATRRAFIMTAVVLIGVMVDRPALTIRTLAIAALLILALTPEALVHPSFQMSFAATLALIAGWERGLPWFSAVPETSAGARVALWGGREVAGLIFISMLAGLATTPYAAYHFHRYAPYGVLANLLAMPIVSIWIMPAGLLALIAMPFGFDAPVWRLMGAGIDWMTAVALWVAKLPGAVGRIAAFPTGPLLLCTTGMILLCLLRTPLRWVGAMLIAAAIVLAVRAPQPDILIAGNGRLVAIRHADGSLRFLKQDTDEFAVREWLAADADPRTTRDDTLTDDTRCDAQGCVGRLADGRFVALPARGEALYEDCRLAAVVVTNRVAPPDCAALAIDQILLRSAGSVALHRSATGFDVTRARPAPYDRPWAPAISPVTPTTKAAPQDATPRREDLDGDDQ